MADIELVIKMPESIWVAIQNGEYCGILDDRMYNAIKNGTPLPEHHGRLIDADSVNTIIRPIEKRDSQWGMTAETAKRLIYDAFDKAPTIIEATEVSK